MDSLRPTHSSWRSQVSLRQNKSKLLFDISSFINTPLDERDLIFKSPHLSLFTLQTTSLVVLIFIEFLCEPLLFDLVNLVNLCEWGTVCFTMQITISNNKENDAGFIYVENEEDVRKKEKNGRKLYPVDILILL